MNIIKSPRLKRAGYRAHQLTEAINARAFTTGNDIFFANGQYNPAGTEGKKLIAHELTHVVQQGKGLTRIASIRNDNVW
ncbi:MAG: DUF4157 domain-containing protein [bacterium]|nr:DUF4157 domain-containing protein [bacterium]